MQDRQMVLPRLSRYSRSPVLIPKIKSRVKKIMSQRAFLGMETSRGSERVFRQALNLPLIIAIGGDYGRGN
jgi:hypothetical protein